MRQRPGAAGPRQQAQTTKRLNEARRKRSDHQVAGERDVRAGARSDPVHRGHHRDRQIADCDHDGPVGLLDHRPQIDRTERRVDRFIVQILTAAEGPSAAGEQQATHRGVESHTAVVDRIAVVHRLVEVVGNARAVVGFVNRGIGRGGISLAAYKLPEALCVVDALPLTVGEKVDRRALVDEITKLLT